MTLLVFFFFFFLSKFISVYWLLISHSGEVPWIYGLDGDEYRFLIIATNDQYDFHHEFFFD